MPFPDKRLYAHKGKIAPTASSEVRHSSLKPLATVALSFTLECRQSSIEPLTGV
jgi:hypothetical protein